MDSRYALCRSCDAPLISTFHWRGKEFYCLECGRLHEWLEPESAEADTPEIKARYEALHAEWLAHAGDLITPGSWLRDCELCRCHQEYHADHATPAQVDADRQARAWLVERRSKA